MKVCSRCGQEKPLDQFHNRRASKDGRSYQCRDCKRSYDRPYYHARKPRWEALRRRAKYGLSEHAYNELNVAQNGRCAICARAKPLVVDHNHETGEVRGLLCSDCNKALGFFKDEIDTIEASIGYLRRVRN